MQNIHIKGYVNSPSYSSATFLFQYAGVDFTVNYGNKEPYLNNVFPCHKEYQNKQGERVKHITNYVQIILPFSILLHLDVLNQTITFKPIFKNNLDVLVSILS